MKIFPLTLLLLFVLALGCATGKIPRAEAPLDLRTLESKWSLLVVTHDEDGSERVTRIWVAVAEGVAAIRTNESRWWANLVRGSEFSIRLDGFDYPVRSVEASGLDERIRIDEAFAEKYVGWEMLMFPQNRGETHNHFAWIATPPSNSLDPDRTGPNTGW